MKKIFIALSLILGNYIFADCPEVLDHEVRLLDSSETVNLCQYEDKVILAVNVASRCGFTYQYESLQALYEKYAKDDFVILGFPSRDFMFQEYSDESKVKEFCSTEYGVTFPMFATSSVKGRKANSFFKALTEESGFIWSTKGQIAAPIPTAPIVYVAVKRKSLLFGFISSLIIFEALM